MALQHLRNYLSVFLTFALLALNVCSLSAGGGNVTNVFGITKVTTSTTEPGWTLHRGIELAYGDNVTFSWFRTHDEVHADAILILVEDENGTLTDPDYPNQEYTVAATVLLSDSTNVIEHESGTENWHYTGDVTWPSPGTIYPTFPTGHLRLAVRYDDGRVVFTNLAVEIVMSIYDVYSDNNAPFYLRDTKEGKTSIYYTLSAPAREGEVNINIGGEKTIEGTTNEGPNVISDAWDGTISTDSYVLGGAYGITFSVTPIHGIVRQGLIIDVDSITNTFIPEWNHDITFEVYIREPVRRPHATYAKLTAIIYSAEGDLIEILANEKQVNIDNQTGSNDGKSLLAWDGRVEQDVVAPGHYILMLTAEDNAGVGCESGAMITDIVVLEPPKSEWDLIWPIDFGGVDDNSNLPAGIPGYSDSGAPIFVSIDGGPETTAAYYEGGTFFVDVPQTAGNHAVTLRTDSGLFPEKQITVNYFINNPSITSPTSGSRFDPVSNGSIALIYSSQIADAVDAFVYAPFDQPSCINNAKPVPAATIMNGTVSPKLLRTLHTNYAVAAGSNVIQWDGKDDAGQFVSPGLYDVVVKRHNADGLLDTETALRIVVERPIGAPVISDITNHVDGATCSIDWKTDVATTGFVVFETDGNPVGKMRTAGQPSINQSVWLVGTEPNSTYDYYVFAVNATTGATSISPKQTATTGNGVQLGIPSSTVKSSTEVRITYATGDTVMAEVEYAQVGPGVSPVQWQKAESNTPGEWHVFDLTGLQPNAEYVFRIVSASDTNGANLTKSPFNWFVTPSTTPSIEFTNLENRQGVESLNMIALRASAAEHARFSTYGITSIELFVDGEAIEQFTQTTSTDYVDYVFDLSSLNLHNGLHEIVAVAYDDYWQSSIERLSVLLNEPPQLLAQQSSANSASIMAEASGSGGPDVPKKNWHAVAINPQVNLIWRSESWPGHAFIEYTNPKTKRNVIRERKWKGLSTDDKVRAISNIPHRRTVRVRDEKKGEFGYGEKQCDYDRYPIDEITWNELIALDSAITASASRPPTYQLLAKPEKTHNCATWVQKMLSVSGIDPDLPNYFIRPDDMLDAARSVNIDRFLHKYIEQDNP